MRFVDEGLIRDGFATRVAANACAMHASRKAMKSRLRIATAPCLSRLGLENTEMPLHYLFITSMQ